MTHLLPHLKQVNPLITERLALDDHIISFLAPFTYGPYALAYRQDALEEAPRSYKELWNAEHRGKVSIADYDTANIYMTALMLGFPHGDLFNLNDSQLQAIESELRTLHQQSQPDYWGENLPVDRAGALNIGTDWGVGVQQINALGEHTWQLVIPEEGATAWVDSWMLSKQCRDDHRIVAHAFIDFSLQSQMQARVARTTSYGITNIYASRPHDRGGGIKSI